MNESGESPTQTLRARTERVKTWAAGEGFDACGVADARVPIDPEGRLRAWLNAGFHADMRWMETTADLREDVQRKLPGARAVIVVARNYFAPRPEATTTATGRVSRYAWGRDYHRALKKPLERLARAITALESNASAYVSIDSGPVLEKAWAVRAGIGWLGKNGLVLRAGLGSYFFLGTIVTTLELVPDAPTADRCGTCRACLEACPTAAIVQSGVVDSRRCISYHTIENRGEIPAEIAQRMGDWVFGCDICQEVCPWNRHAPTTNETDFHPRPGRANPVLAELATMSPEVFLDRFCGSPVMRTKVEGLQRNAARCLRNRASENEGPFGE